MEGSTCEKIMCFDRPAYEHNNDALIAALANRNSDSFVTAAMMNGGFGGNAMMWNNPLIYFLVASIFNNGCGGGFMNRGGCGAGVDVLSIQDRLNSLQSTLDTNHNNDLAMAAINGNTGAIRELQSVLNTDFNSISTALCNVKNAITEVGGQVNYSAERVINAANLGDTNIIMALKDCCCQNKELVQRMGYENQLGQRDMTAALQQAHTQLGFNMQQGFDRTNTGLERGFSSVAYEAQRQTCDIINAGERNTQRIIDVLNNHWQADLQQRYNDARLELSQKTQNEYLVNQLKGKCCQ